MAVRPYDDTDAGYRGATASDVAAKVFVWLAWALAAAFWGFSLTTGVGIMQSLGDVRGPSGQADVGGVSWLLINFVGGVLVLGGAIAYGLIQWASRDRRKDPATEAATHAIYDMAEAAGGDDDVSRSPGAHRPEERDAARAAQADLNR